MFDADTIQKIPPYEVKVGGEVKSFDALEVGYKLRGLEGVDEPEKIRKQICEVFEVEVDSFTASAILHDFYDFAKNEMNEPLKKVFGRGLFSTTTSESSPESSQS